MVATHVAPAGWFGWKKFQRHKKREEACASSPCRSIGTPHWWTADPPWPFQLRPIPQYSASGLRSRDFYSRLISRRLSVFRFHRVAPVSSSVSRTCVPFTSRLFRLAPSKLWTFRCRSCFLSVIVRSVNFSDLFRPSSALTGSSLSTC